MVFLIFDSSGQENAYKNRGFFGYSVVFVRKSL
jgi:hypothetical protein